MVSLVAASLLASSLRPPSVPLIVHDPYFSIWSASDKLPGSWTRHWTGSTMAICSLVRIDGKPYLLAGNPGYGIPSMEQKSLRVEATTTHYQFSGGGIDLKLDFFTPSFADELDTLSRPVGFVRFSYESATPHKVEVYFDVTGEWVVNEPDQRVSWGRVNIGSRSVLRMGSQAQEVLGKRGDDLRIDWGHLYVVPPTGAQSTIQSDDASRGTFLKDGTLPTTDDVRMPRRANDGWPVLGTSFALEPSQPKSVVLAYDDEDSLLWLRRPVQAYWRRLGLSFGEMLSQALQSESAWRVKASKIDSDIRSKATQIGGDKYADLACLSYRQSLGAHKIVADIDGDPLMFSKENFSNGCIGTVDVLYPAAPIMLALNPEMLAANLRPLFIYSSLPRWKFPFAPHDLGTYPWANGQVYGGGERDETNQMPVEESANLIILAAAYVDFGGDINFIRKYRPLLDKWSQYLLEKGLDPENQLCTDDFAGHLAHNANLSAKAIVALASYAKILPKLAGDKVTKDYAAHLRKQAEGMVQQWIKLADDGNQFRLAFDKAGTWSQKYNLVWDKVLGLKLFPKSVYDKELDHYATVIQPYGLPLDSRRMYTKLDWCVWTATLSRDRAEFEKFVAPLWRYANETSGRVPLCDWYETKDAKMINMIARSVVGGVFMPFLVRDGGPKAK